MPPTFEGPGNVGFVVFTDSGPGELAGEHARSGSGSARLDHASVLVGDPVEYGACRVTVVSEPSVDLEPGSEVSDVAGIGDQRHGPGRAWCSPRSR